MSLFSAIILGVVQGLTEFFPVSSSGHLVIAQSMIPGFVQPGVLFDVVLHGGTSLAVVYYFRERILSIKKKDVFVIAVGSIPAGLFGILFRSFFEILFAGIGVVGFALIISGAMNYFTDKRVARRRFVGITDAFLIGIAQAVAIIPGISRSGATIFTGTSLGVDRREAAEFSFILSVPAIIGANAVELLNHGSANGPGVGYYLAGFMASFGVSLLAIRAVTRLLVERKFRIFSVYCILLGLLIIGIWL